MRRCALNGNSHRITSCRRPNSERAAEGHGRRMEVYSLVQTERGSDPLLKRGELRVGPIVGVSAFLHMSPNSSRSGSLGSKIGKVAATAAGVHDASFD